MIRLSVVIITFNEEKNIERCIRSAADLADEVLVVDSFSTDATRELAAGLGARVLTHAFEGHRQQKAWAIEQARNEYVLSLDADEALSGKLADSVRKALENWTHDGYYMNRMSRIGGRWIRHGGWYPDRKMRLFDRRCYRIGGVNPHDRFDPAPGARTTRLQGDLLHYTNDDLTARVETINKFSTIAAQAYFDRGKRGNWWRLLFKPAGRFLAEYIVRRGFLDGFYGYAIAQTSAQYVFLREAKLWAMTNQQ